VSKLFIHIKALKIILLIVILFSIKLSFAQKVGVVLSGGGAKGLAHIGVMKALEENNIPVDYAIGTSMGGIVSGMYASGYSPSEIEYIATSNDFQQWVRGDFDSPYKQFFIKKDLNSSFFSLKALIDTSFQIRIRSSLANDIPLNFALLQLLAQPSANSGYNFDSLMIPFRCMVADIFTQKAKVMSRGSVNEAIRGTFTVPYVYRPIKINDQYVFDGGIYNNFPVDVIKQEFNPDIIIGSNVANVRYKEYPFADDDKLVSQLYRSLLVSRSDSTSVGKNGIYIQPDVEIYDVTDFGKVQELIDSGYVATMRKMPEIKAAIQARQTNEQIDAKRKAFNTKNPQMNFTKTYITGIRENQKKYVARVFRQKPGTISLKDIKNGFYKLVADDNFETAYPRTLFNKTTQTYNFELQVKPEKNFKIDFGGNISSRPINQVFLGFQYNYLNRNSYTFNLNLYSGRFYEAVQAKIRWDIPTRIPFFIEPEFTFNHWDFFRSSEIFLEDLTPVFLNQTDRSIGIKAGIQAGKQGKLILATTLINLNNEYSQTSAFKSKDTLDKSIFEGQSFLLEFTDYTLNRKQYASSGKSLVINLRYINGTEDYTFGTTAVRKTRTKISENWIQARLNYEKYNKSIGIYTFGYLIDAAFSTQPNFNNYRSTLLLLPTFYPTADSRSLFLERYRAAIYGAFGIKNIFEVKKNISIRLEGFVFQPYKYLIDKELQNSSFNSTFKIKPSLTFSGMAVYTSPVGPVAIGINYYDDTKRPISFLLHAGFLLYNKRALE